jgi:hypothetical protein
MKDYIPQHPMARAVQSQRAEVAAATARGYVDGLPIPSATNPAHYTRFVIQPMTFATANNLSGLELNVVKYTVRAPYKNGVEDYRKAIRCLEMLIETADRKERIASGEDPCAVWSVML